MSEMAEQQWRADQVFAISALADGRVRVCVETAGTELEMDMAPQSALWLAHELLKAAQVPWPPPLRFTRRAANRA